MHDDRRQLDDWILEVTGRLREGLASTAEIRRLEDELTKHPESVRLYLEIAALDVQLGMTTESLAAICPRVEAELESLSGEIPNYEPVLPLKPKDSTNKGRSGWRSFFLPVGLAGLSLIAASLVVTMSPHPEPRVYLERGVGQQFHGDVIASSHQDIVGRQFDLSAGFVELNFRKASATVVIEAPAKFCVQDAKTLQIDRGRITAHVRDGEQGLRVITPDMDVLDLGTRFAVDVTSGQRSEVHVFEGKVEAGVAKSDERQLLNANEAVRFSSGLEPEACNLRLGAFVEAKELQRLEAGLLAGQAARARRAFVKLKADRELLAAFDFDGMESGEVVEVHGARSVQGRFPGSRALDFVDVEDRARLNYRMAAQQFTIMTWVRLNSELTDTDYSSIYHTDGWDTKGQVHWMIRCPIGYMGRMLFAIHSGTGEPGYTALWAGSRRTVLTELNLWAHLAITYDGDLRQVTFYMNGEEDTSAEIPIPLGAVLGPAEIGNWTPNGDKPRRQLCGRVDELLIHSRILSAAEIKTYYDETTPYR